MSNGESFVSTLPLKTLFHDGNKRRTYERTRRLGVSIIDDPNLVALGRQFLDRHVRNDSWQRSYYLLWVDLLRQDPRVIVSQMLEDTPRGEMLRDTQPVFRPLADGRAV